MPDIRKAGIEDIPLIQQLTYAIWPDAYKEILRPEQLEYMLQLIYSKEALINQLMHLNHQFIILSENNNALGFASYSPKKKEDTSTYRLHKLYVLPNQQGKGTGRKLLDYIIADAKQAGAINLELNVNRYNKALHFYHKLGFNILYEEDIDIGHGYFMNDYVMSLEL